MHHGLKTLVVHAAILVRQDLTLEEKTLYALAQTYKDERLPMTRSYVSRVLSVSPHKASRLVGALVRRDLTPNCTEFWVAAMESKTWTEMDS